MCVALIPTGIWVLTRVRKATGAEVAAAPAESQPNVGSEPGL
jgi:hypothetical protein